MECPALPKGWKREEVIRRTGLSAGKIDVYYYSPTGKKFRSKPQLARYLGDTVDLSTFDFRTGKINSMLLRKSKRQRGAQFDYSRGIRNDTSLVPPIRQTASIFKQPVTVVKSQESKVRTDFKHGPQEKPKQLFWEKRLQGLKACDVNEEAFQSFDLPKNMRGVGPDLTEETLLRSIATALHVSAQPITGQTGSKSGLEKNPGVHINPDQPLVQALVVTDDDIRKQEEKVHQARKKLEEALIEIST
ncbi:methyl-CpG-binding domain protein 2 [Centruroides vittatus]|uniref:methyl-CpG-binding domain protein 2 n=1 Tax=Centruroides vittatus TaxID=120091 RepID=UPI000C6DDC8A|nr:methyl-CpG-binding domain protein 2-like isoform X2 [Centruroides sculpturatus]